MRDRRKAIRYLSLVAEIFTYNKYNRPMGYVRKRNGANKYRSDDFGDSALRQSEIVSPWSAVI